MQKRTYCFLVLFIDLHEDANFRELAGLLVRRIELMVVSKTGSNRMETLTPPKREVDVIDETQTIHIPQYHVILYDDNDHTYDYVIEMLSQLFGYDQATAMRMAYEVDSTGRVIVATTTKERAELKRDQIHAYGPDPRIEKSKGSMEAAIEPAE